MNFDNAFQHVLKVEGGFVNHPLDPGAGPIAPYVAPPEPEHAVAQPQPTQTGAEQF